MKGLLMLGVTGAMLSVILGALAAHGLKAKVSADMLAVFQTGVHYQMYHSLGIILIAILYRHQPQALLLWSAGLMLVGILAFSGSLYALALTQIKWFGPVTPLGGLCFIGAWALMLYSVWISPSWQG